MYIEELTEYPKIPDDILDRTLELEIINTLRYNPEIWDGKDFVVLEKAKRDNFWIEKFNNEVVNVKEDNLRIDDSIKPVNFWYVSADKIGGEVMDWLKVNIPSPQYWYWQCMYAGNTLMPHRDPGRDYSILYLVDTGGEHAATTFYKPKSKDLNEFYRSEFHNFDEIELVDQKVLKPRTWYKLDVNALHAVVNIQGIRFGLAHSLPDVRDPDEGTDWNISAKWQVLKKLGKLKDSI